MAEENTRKLLYEKIAAIISEEDNFPAFQAKALADLAKTNDSLYRIFYLLLVALRVMYWRKDAADYRNTAANIENNAGMLEELNIN